MKKNVIVIAALFLCSSLNAVTLLLDKKEKFSFDAAACQALSNTERERLCKKNSLNLTGVTKEQFERFGRYLSFPDQFDVLKNFLDFPIFFSIADQLKLRSIQERVVDALVGYFQNDVVLKEYQGYPLTLPPLAKDLLQKVISRLGAQNQLIQDIFRFMPLKSTAIAIGEDLSLYFVNAVFDPLGKWLAFVEEVGSVVVIDTADGSVKHTLTVERTDMPYLVGAPLIIFSPTGDRIIRATESGMMYVWNTQSGQLLKKIPYSKQIVAGAFFKTGQMLLAADEDNTLIIFDLKTGTIRSSRIVMKKPITKSEESALGDVSIKQVPNLITHMALNKQGTLAAIAFYDNSIELWSMATVEKIATVENNYDIAFMDFVGADLELVTKPADLATALKNIVTPVDVTIERKVLSIDQSGNTEVKERTAIKTKMLENVLSYDPKRNRCVLLGSNFVTELWDLKAGQKIATLGTSIEGVPLALNPVKDQLLTMQIGQQMNLVDLGELVQVKNQLAKLTFQQAIFLQILAHEVAAYRSLPLDRAPWKTIMNSFSPTVQEALRKYATISWWKKPAQKFIDTVTRFFSGTPAAEK